MATNNLSNSKENLSNNPEIDGLDGTNSVNGPVVLSNSASSSIPPNQPIQHIISDHNAATRQARVIMLDSLQHIPIFTGQDPNYTISHFEQRFKDWSGFLIWPKDDCLFAVKQRLAGRAQQTLETYSEQIKTVEDLFKILKGRFDKIEDPAQVLNEFWSFKQSYSMSVSEFVALAKQKVRKVLKLQKFPESLRETTQNDWLFSMLITNLETNIRKEVIARNPKSLEELIDIATCEERAILATRVPQKVDEPQEFLAVASVKDSQNDLVKEFTSVIKGLSEQIENFQVRVDKLEQQQTRARNETQNRRDNGNFFDRRNVCYLCGSPDHFQRDCNKKTGHSYNQKGAVNSEPPPRFRDNGNYNYRGNFSGRGRGKYKSGNSGFYNNNSQNLNWEGSPQTWHRQGIPK